MQDKLMKTSVLIAGFFFLVSIAVMAYTNQYKVIAVEEMEFEHNENHESAQSVLLSMKENNASESTIEIPLPYHIQTQSIQIQNQYTLQELWIFIECDAASFYETNEVLVDFDKVLGSEFEVYNTGILLTFCLDSVYEYTSVIVNDVLKITFSLPKEVYEQRIVIDMGSCDTKESYVVNDISEEDILLPIINYIKNNFDDAQTKIYYCGLAENESLDCIALAEVVNADLLIAVQTNYNENDTLYGLEVSYNGQFFMPQVSCAQIADLIAKNIAMAINDRVNGIYGNQNRYEILERTALPTFIIEIGYMSNAQEFILLQESSYQEKIAQAIMTAIYEIYEFLD